MQLSASYLQLYKSGQVSEGSVGDGSEAVPVKQTEKKKQWRKTNNASWSTMTGYLGTSFDYFIQVTLP